METSEAGRFPQAVSAVRFGQLVRAGAQEGNLILQTIQARTLGTCLAASGALAGACPADQVLTTPRQIENAPDVGVDRPVLHEVVLTGWRGMGSFDLRMRRLTVALNGIVPTHDHHDRPSIMRIQSGKFIAHSTFCAVPILHKPREPTPEFGPGHRHWWENKAGKPVVLISTDVIPVGMMTSPMADMP